MTENEDLWMIYDWLDTNKLKMNEWIDWLIKFAPRQEGWNTALKVRKTKTKSIRIEFELNWKITGNEWTNEFFFFFCSMGF